ncbi:Metallo-beta-lactamase superfamily protein [Flavobacterium anhuiense]|uniref:Metallo-beta-lactamase superfamily protein n=1 Tax=Flavobacterium anhuiense TaxID=459526 RepID=A0ABY0LG77_9FLAO|nr:AVAST type 1 anti-phage system MBL fold metallo-hydrolase Avs1a [Flavobacterium anhuiense]SCY13792.1 Metallo-beta-lactamase superfamily protein [Flavobacterium anhuiense]
MIQIEIFPAVNGDCFLLHLEEGLILIDCGYASTFTEHLKPVLETLHGQGKSILRFILTHIDEDHIQGALKFLAENGSAENPSIIKIEEIWHNSYRHLQGERSNDIISNESELLLKSSFSAGEVIPEKQISAKQGSSLGALILKHGYNWNTDFNDKAFSIDHFSEIKIGENIKFEFLSPDDMALERLEKYWKKELYRLGFREKITNQKIFDDAFEFMLLSEKIVPDETLSKAVSASAFDVEELKKQKCAFDKTPKNGSSLAFILTVYNKKMLFMGDAVPAIIEQQLMNKKATEENPMQFDLIKLSHHGSYGNNSPTFFKITDSSKYLISTNGISNPHPSKPTLAWLIGRPTKIVREIYFNYQNEGYNLLNNDILKETFKYSPVLVDNPSKRKFKI